MRGMYPARRMLAVLFAAAALASSLPSAEVQAAELKVMYVAGSPSLDPHWSFQPGFRPLRGAVYEGLLELDNDGKPVGKLAESWRLIDDVTWEFKLRKGVVFSDGTPLAAEDIAFSYARTASLKDGPSPLTQYLRLVKDVKVIDASTVHIVTHRPAPFLWYDATMIPIGSKKLMEGAKPVDFAVGDKAGEKAVGTGPYKVVNFMPNDIAVVVPNEKYWGPKPVWDKVTLKATPQDATRVAALLAGDFDAIENVPYTDVDRMKANPKVNVFTYRTGGLAWMTLPRTDKVINSGTVTDMEGKPLDTNPMADQRVRDAMVLAINADGMTQRIYNGGAISSGQYVPSNHPAAIPEIKKWTYDEAKAIELMKESGWHGKFKLMITGIAASLPEGQKFFEALAQSFNRIGIKADIQLLPAPVYFERRNQGKTSVVASQYLNTMFNAEGWATPLLHSRDQVTGYGSFNYSEYRNPEVDRLIDELMQIQDEAKRQPMVVQAMRLALADHAIVPLWHFTNSYATRKGIRILPRTTGYGIKLQDIVPE